MPPKTEFEAKRLWQPLLHGRGWMGAVARDEEDVGML